ncbi:MAG: insulinase family protein [Bacteroidales bacterium]|nr:insulinase family protein [Bacteroidales bacterium]
MRIDMTGLNRKIAPKTGFVDNISFIDPEKAELNNGIPVYIFNSEEQDLVKIEFLFRAGSWYQEKPLVARITNKMLKEGTRHFTSHEIAEKIDYYGAHLNMSTDKDMGYVSLYTLNKHLEPTLEILAEVIKHPVFPENEFNRIIQNRKQKFIVSNEKVRFIAKRKFDELIFGSQNPYGKTYEVEDFDKLNTADLAEFHRLHYRLSDCRVLVSGKVMNRHVDLLNKFFNGEPVGNSDNHAEPADNTISSNNRMFHIVKNDALQSAIRMGKVMFNKTHPDYTKLKILNTVLGGYFGSRLMTNIREEKGYTYGIGSALVSLHHSGYFFIASEVGADVTQDASNEIYHEIRKLQEEKIPEKELDLVRNYMLGAILRNLDGAFARSDNFKEILEYGLNYSYYKNFIEVIRSITAAELRDLAQKYLDRESLYELRVGK